MSTVALDALVEALHAAFESDVAGRRIGELLATYASEHEDWRPWALFDEAQYTRNLVIREERYELMILCWGVGQESPIHNHEGQDCWMAVLDGAVEELRYRMPGAGTGALDPHDAKAYGVGQVAFIHDDIGLHLVRSADRGRPAVSLHLYTAPYDACNCYCPETGHITRTKLVNYSERGRLVAPELS